MRKFRIGSAFGIPIQLDLTFLIILPIFAWLIGSQVGVFVEQLNTLWGTSIEPGPLTTGSMPWLLGSLAAIGLFVGVVLHELGHSLVAMRYGFPIESITLWIFGGIAQLTDTPEDWRQELLIALAGPAVSIVLGAICYVAFIAVPDSFGAAAFVLGYLALMNLVLAAFNLLPGFPMDGGRVLRALLARTRPFARATQIAAEVGKVFAFLLGIVGLLGGNLLLIGIAFFIYIGASGEAQQTVMKAAFQDVTVRDVMTPATEVETVSPDRSVADLVELMFRQRHTGYPVMDDGTLVGLVTLEDAREVDPVERDAFLVEDIMSTDLQTIAPEDDAMTAFVEMQRNGIGRLLVVDDEDRLVGLVTRSDLLTAFNIIRSSGAFEPTPDRVTEVPVRNRAPP